MRTFTEAAKIGAKLILCCVFAGAAWWLWQTAQVQHTDRDWLYVLGAFVLGYVSLKMLFQVIKAILLYRHQLKLRFAVHQQRAVPHPGDGMLLGEKEIKRLGFDNPNCARLSGVINGRPVFMPYIHCLVLALPGSGKTTGFVVPALCHGYRITHPYLGYSKVVSLVTTDLKWENYPMTARLRRERYHQKTLILNPGHPETARYEPLDLVVEAIKSNTIAKAITIAESFAHILEPEPAQDDAKNKFWRLGPRLIIHYCILYICDTQPETASLIAVTDLLADGEKLWETLEASINSEAYHGEMAKLARTITSMGKYFLEHLLTARFDLQSFGAGRQVAACLGKSSFHWRDLKQRSMAVYLGGQLSEQKPLKIWLKLMMECLCMELQDERNGGNISVDILLEEATNFGFDISDKLAALRGQGGRVTLIVQSLSELERVYGKHQAETIWALTDLKILMGGSHDVALANKISAILGDQHCLQAGYAGGYQPADNIRENHSLQKHPLMSPYEIMTLKGQLVLMKGVGNILCDPVSYDHVKPWRRWLDNNPIEGGKLKGKATMTLHYARRWRGWQKIRVTGFKRKKHTSQSRTSVPFLLNYLWLGFAALYLAGGFAIWSMEGVKGHSPHMLWDYEYRSFGRHKAYLSCTYIGVQGRRLLRTPGYCGLIRMIAHRPAY